MLKAIHPIPAPFVFLLVLPVFFSCSAPKNTAYFQTLPRDTVLLNTVGKNWDLKIKPDDLLSIGVTSASSELSSLYNSAQGGGGTPGYLVDKNGNIQFFKLGDVKAAGLTRDELKTNLLRELSPYLKDPVVTVRFANNHVTVLGEVGSAGVRQITTEQISVWDLLGESGDMKETAKKQNVLVIRQTDSGKVFKHLNLLDHSIFTSPYYYLQNGDIVYVEPDPKRKSTQSAPQIISYVVSGISIITYLVNQLTK